MEWNASEDGSRDGLRREWRRDEEEINRVRIRAEGKKRNQQAKKEIITGRRMKDIMRYSCFSGGGLVE
jgi:hypothetical protein